MSQPNVEFEWSDEKAASNLKKHGVDFDEATTAFGDEHSVVVDDETHSDAESREILIGYSNSNHLLFVSFVRRQSHRIRIISARLADKSERIKYEQEKRF